jgi:hypothetical protein
MQSAGADFTLTFRRLARCADEPADDASLLELFASSSDIAGLAAALARAPRKRAAECRGARREHAPRESRIHSAQPPGGGRARSSRPRTGTSGRFTGSVNILEHPYDDQPGCGEFEQPPAPGERVLRTFCGT